jgi:hypothetical protein
MRLHRPPDRFGLPPNYRWIHGQPPDSQISIVIPYTHSDDIVTVSLNPFRVQGCALTPKQNNNHKIKEDIKCQ